MLCRVAGKSLIQLKYAMVILKTMKLLWHKNYYNQRKEPSKKNKDLLDSVRSSEEAGDLPFLKENSSIVRVDAHGRSLSARSELSADKGTNNSATAQENRGKFSFEVEIKHSFRLNGNGIDAQYVVTDTIKQLMDNKLVSTMQKQQLTRLMNDTHYIP